MAISEHLQDKAEENDRALVSVWLKEDLSGYGKFAAHEGSKILKAYEDYYQVKYPLPKLDNIGLIKFGGAMENWGLIVYG